MHYVKDVINEGDFENDLEKEFSKSNNIVPGLYQFGLKLGETLDSIGKGVANAWERFTGLFKKK